MSCVRCYHTAGESSITYQCRHRMVEGGRDKLEGARAGTAGARNQSSPETCSGNGMYTYAILPPTGHAPQA